MQSDHLVVHDTASGLHATAEVTRREGDYAHVVADQFEGWVEVPENPAEPTPVLVCEDCGHMAEDPKTGMMYLADVKENECNHVENAELLAQAHRIKTGHSPRVERRA